MNARRHCNMSGLHMNWEGTNILIENILFYLNKFSSNYLVTKVSENSKKSVQFKLISMQNNSNSDLTKELDKGQSCLKKLNINSLRNKFEYLKEIIKNMFDVFLVSECKLDLSIPDTQFQIGNYNMFRKDRNKNGGGLLFYVNQDLNCKIVNMYNSPTDIEINL